MAALQAALVPGSMRALAVAGLAPSGAAGATADGVVAACAAAGLRAAWDEQARRALLAVLQTDPSLCHVGGGRFALRLAPGVVPLESEYQAAQRGGGLAQRKQTARGTPGGGGGAGAGAGATAGAGRRAYYGERDSASPVANDAEAAYEAALAAQSRAQRDFTAAAVALEAARAGMGSLDVAGLPPAEAAARRAAQGVRLTEAARAYAAAKRQADAATAAAATAERAFDRALARPAGRGRGGAAAAAAAPRVPDDLEVLAELTERARAAGAWPPPQPLPRRPPPPCALVPPACVRPPPAADASDRADVPSASSSLLSSPAAAGEAPPPADVARPPAGAVWRGPEAGQLSDAVYVADFITEFSPHIGLRPLTWRALQGLLTAGALAAPQAGEVRPRARARALFFAHAERPAAAVCASFGPFHPPPAMSAARPERSLTLISPPHMCPTPPY